MKQIVVLVSMLLVFSSLIYGQVGVDNTDPHPSSILDLSSTDKGLLTPRMTTAQRLAIASPASSLLVFDTTLGGYFYYFNGGWESFSSRWSSGSSGSDIYYSSGNVGIGTTSPNAPLHFGNGANNRKIILNEDGNNDHQVNAFGVISGGHTRFQIPTTSTYYGWYAGTSSTTSNELMRITGNGNVGIGVTNPTSRLHVADHIFVDNGNAHIRFGESSTFVGRAGGTGFHFSNASIGDLAIRGTSGKKVLIGVHSGLATMAVTENNVGIGTTSPNAPLQFANSSGKKIVLYESNNNDYEYYGFGLGPDAFQYKVSTTAGDHVFYAGTSSATSNELMRIKGNGLVSVPASMVVGGGSPAAYRQFQVNGGTESILRVNAANGFDPYIEFTDGGSVANSEFWQLYKKNSDHSFRFYNGGSDKFIFTADGNLGIGGSPSSKLHVFGSEADVSMKVTNTSTGQAVLRITRTGGTTSNWAIYSPTGSTELRFNPGSDKFAFSATGTGTATDWVATSDRRLKDNIVPAEDQLGKVVAISGLVKNYERKDNGKNETGFIAQELAEIAPEYVNVPDDPKDMQSVNYAKMVVPLYKGTTELADEVQRLKKELSNEVERSTNASKRAADEIALLKKEIEELRTLLK